MEWEAQEWKMVYVKKHRTDLRKMIFKKQNGGGMYVRSAIVIQKKHMKTDVGSYF